MERKLKVTTMTNIEVLCQIASHADAWRIPKNVSLGGSLSSGFRELFRFSFLFLSFFFFFLLFLDIKMDLILFVYDEGESRNYFIKLELCLQFTQTV